MKRALLLCMGVAVALAGCSTGSAWQWHAPQPAADKPARAPGAAAAGAGDSRGGGPEAAPASSAGGVHRVAAIDPRKVIYTGEFELVVADVGRAVASAKALAERLEGYVQRMTLKEIVLRVPAARFDEAVAALEKMGPVIARNILAQDVTEQYADLEARLKNARAMLDRLEALLEKAQDVKAALEVEREMVRVRTEIDSLQGQLNRLANLAAYATLTVSFRPAAAAPPELKVSLPFSWLYELGLDRLMHFSGRRVL